MLSPCQYHRNEVPQCMDRGFNITRQITDFGNYPVCCQSGKPYSLFKTELTFDPIRSYIFNTANFSKKDETNFSFRVVDFLRDKWNVQAFFTKFSTSDNCTLQLDRYSNVQQSRYTSYCCHAVFAETSRRCFDGNVPKSSATTSTRRQH